jgi:hypothetical protein
MMNSIAPTGFEIVYSDNFVTKYQGSISGHCVELDRVVFRGRTDWTCEIDGIRLFAAVNDARAKRRLGSWLESVR